MECHVEGVGQMKVTKSTYVVPNQGKELASNLVFNSLIKALISFHVSKSRQ